MVGNLEYNYSNTAQKTFDFPQVIWNDLGQFAANFIQFSTFCLYFSGCFPPSPSSYASRLFKLCSFKSSLTKRQTLERQLSVRQIMEFHLRPSYMNLHRLKIFLFFYIGSLWVRGLPLRLAPLNVEV